MSQEQSVVNLSQLKKRAVNSFVSLSARQIALRAISFISLNVVLAKILPVETLGVFNVATAIVTFFAFFSDVGLAASLIQKKEGITKEDISTVFTIQQLIISVLSLIIIIAASYLGKFYGLQGDDGIWLIRILGIAFFLTSLKVVPSVLLERELKFQPLVTVEIVETLVFNSLLILLVIKNFGIWSFSAAALARGMVGTSLIYILAPVKIRFGINKESAKQLLSFGVPYQANSLLALLKDRLVPLVVARMVGPVGVGLITWSQSIAFLPLEIMNIVIRITFPAFSRIQHDKKALETAVEKSLFLTALLVYPLLFGLGAVLPSVVKFVVSSKWQPAVASFYLFAFSSFWAVISTTFTNTLNAIGQIKLTLKLMIMWTVLTWLLTPLLVLQFGFLGVAISSFLISFSSVVTIILVKKLLEIRVLEAIWSPILASLVMSVIIYLISQNLVRDKLTLFGTIILGGVIYCLIMLALAKNKILADLKSLKNE